MIGTIKVTRPPLLILGAIAPIALLLWVGKSWVYEGFLILITIFLGNAGWTLLNEYFDAEVDAINKPHKPIPSGSVEAIDVLVGGTLCIIVSLIANILVLRYNVIYSVGFLGHFCSYVYNVVRKDFLGNGCLGAVYGIASLMCLWPKHLFFSLAFATFTLSFNILQQWQDEYAELSKGIVTASKQLGKFKLPVVWILSLISLILYYLVYLPIMPKFLFMLGSVSVFCGGFAIIRNDKYLIEILCRRLSRLFLLFAFILLMIIVSI